MLLLFLGDDFGRAFTYTAFQKNTVIGFSCGGMTNTKSLTKGGRVVLCRIKSKTSPVPDSLVIGYLKYAAGRKDSPQFVIPGHGGEVIEWCDCLPKDFYWPKVDISVLIEKEE